MNPTNRIELAENNLQRINGWISNSDSKIGIILAFQAGVIVLLTTKGAEIKSIIQKDSIGLLDWILYLSIVLFIWFIANSVFRSFKGLYPDIKIRNQSLFFFASITSKKVEDFKKEFASMNEKDILEEINDQVHINSTIANAKMGNIRASIINFYIGAIFWLLTLLLLPWLK